MVYTKDKLDVLGICVIIPTYNNDKTIKTVIDSCLEMTRSIIVVNDGSTDNTDEILRSYGHNEIDIVSYAINKGKGYALKRGFEYARSKSYRYAITIDADGQHFASDIPLFIGEVEKNPNALIVGSRFLNAENMPRQNTFANKFSNFWFTVQTLQSVPDTQTGFRLYPLEKMGRMWWMTSRYEAELEMLVYAAWHGVKIISTPINVYYPDPDKRISHFRPFMDFFRISVLNTILCFLAICYGGPRMLINNLFGK